VRYLKFVPTASAYPADFYAALHRGNTGDLAFYTRECQGSDSVLELGCGAGRILLTLAAERRVGVECHPGLLDLANHTQSKMLENAHVARLILGDMVETLEQLQDRFDRIIIPYGGLYCVLSEDRIARLFAAVRTRLNPGGQLLLDVYAADGFHTEASPEDIDAETLVPLTQVYCRDQNYEVFESSHWDPTTQRIDVNYLYVPPHEDEGLLTRIEQRYLLSAQLREAIDTARLKVLELSGDFERTPYNVSSDLMVLRAGLG